MSRFGIKIVVAMLLIAVVPLVASVFLVNQVIQGSHSVAEGEADRLAEPLRRSAEAYRSLFEARKQVFSLESRIISQDGQLASSLKGKPDLGVLRARVRQLVDRTPGLGRLVVRDRSGLVIGSAERTNEFPETQFKHLQLKAPLQHAAASIECTFFTSNEAFENFRRLGRAQESVRGIADLRADLGWYYQLTFIAMFGAAVAIASFLGWLIARRTVKRVSLLAGATRQVAAGDLNTRVDVGPRWRDEMGELALSFNEMVAQLSENRERIAYLEKIGAWQEIARRLAHEIKNPLTPIQLAMQQLHRKYQGDNSDFKKMLNEANDIIGEEIHGLRRLVGEFSSFARLPDVRPEPVNVNNLLEEFFKSHAELTEQAEIRWTALEGSYKVLADRMLIRHVFFNLVENGDSSDRWYR